MEEPKDRILNEEFWKAHIEKAKNFKGSNLEYCRLNSLNARKLSYYKLKFRRAMKSKKSFSKVQLKSVPSTLKVASINNNLPDPKWLAEVLKALVVK